MYKISKAIDRVSWKLIRNNDLKYIAHDTRFTKS